MDDLKQQMKEHFVQYASYVILDRAIPHVVDGLKPVQRRILETLYRQHDEKLHKVANIVGQTMQLHPHGDVPIYEALVTLANKGYLLDRQGNFGNPHTADPAAAARYIETRLSPLARQTLFNPEITEKIPSYDGRNLEPVTLPAKIPLILMQGADGIAVGMSTSIFPHNFNELLEAQIAYLEGKPFRLFPDFLSGGIMDKSDYDRGCGKIKLRAKIDIKDAKTLVIKEICHSTTTESLIRSIDEAAKKGKIKIESIHDYTAEKVEIEIKLPRGQYAEELIESLFAFTECEVTLHSQIIVIKDGLPWETNVHDVLIYTTEKLIGFLKQELELEKAHLLEKIFHKTLERIFIENRLYKKIESVKTLEGIHETLAAALMPYHKKLLKEPGHEEREKLLQIPIRKISQFDIDRNKEEIALLEEALATVEKQLKNVKKYTINYIKGLLNTFGTQYPRKTKIKTLEEIDRKAVSTKNIKVGIDLTSGFCGTKVSGPEHLKCTNFDKLLILHQDGSYKATNITEKLYVAGAIHIDVADKKTPFYALYKDTKTRLVYGKKFIVTQFILDKLYRYLPEGAELLYIAPEKEIKPILLDFAPQKGKQPRSQSVPFEEIPLQSPQAKGVRLSPHPLKKVRP
jgi:topoisomerase-4 subunit A